MARLWARTRGKFLKIRVDALLLRSARLRLSRVSAVALTVVQLLSRNVRRSLTITETATLWLTSPHEVHSQSRCLTINTSITTRYGSHWRKKRTGIVPFCAYSAKREAASGVFVTRALCRTIFNLDQNTQKVRKNVVFFFILIRQYKTTCNFFFFFLENLFVKQTNIQLR